MSQEMIVIEVPKKEWCDDAEGVRELCTETSLVNVMDDDGQVYLTLSDRGVTYFRHAILNAAYGHGSEMRRFVLNRKADVTGVSGIGVVAEGVQFSDGTIALRWRGDYSSTVIHANIHSVEHIHLHHGATVVEWIDEA